MKLRPYHNPESVDESKVPAGWRMLYADEAGKFQRGPCVMWRDWLGFFKPSVAGWDTGSRTDRTYIVPVTP